MKLTRIPLPQGLIAQLVTVFAVLALVVVGATVGIKRFTGLSGDAAFRYAGTVVTQDQLARRVELLGALYGVAMPADAKGKASFRRDTAKAVAVSMILDRAARSHKIVIADKSARDTLASMIKNQLGDDGQAQFTQILGEFGVNEQNVLDEVKRQQATARLFQAVTAKVVAATDSQDARAYFDKDPARFAVPETRHLVNIVVATRKEADQVLARATSNVRFTALAEQVSLDDSTRSSGGDLGKVQASQLETQFAAAAFSAPLDRNFGPVQTKFGWNVGRVVGVQAGHTVTFDQVSAQVLDALRSRRAMKTWQAFVAEAIKDAHVEYAKKYRPAHPDAPPTEQPVVPTIAPATQP